MKSLIKPLLIFMLIVLFSARFPLDLPIEQVEAATFSMQTGYYVGTGSSGLAISGLGFQPQVVMIKSTTSANFAAFKTSAMAGNVTAFFGGAADDTSTGITLDADGFTLGTITHVNSANVMYMYIAFAGSDCTSSGTICVGTYSGDGSSPRAINTGFGPSFVMVKRSTNASGNFRVASEPTNEGLFFSTAARDTGGALFTTLDSGGFTVGATNNASGGTYYYIAFKSVTNFMAEGTYSGNATDNTNITTPGFKPEFVMVKNATSGTTANRAPLFTTKHVLSDSSGFLSAASANVVNAIQELRSDGFQIGTDARVNESSATLYWVAFKGGSTPSGSGTFEMANGNYTGNNTSQTITGLAFAPDLVIVKGADTNYAVFRTSVMAGDSTAYFGPALADFTGGITTLTSDGFTIGSNAITNTSSVVYQWTAFGNAMDPYTRSGAADFEVGAYFGNGLDDADMVGLSFQPDLVVTKRSGASRGIWRITENSGDQTNFFDAQNSNTGNIKSINTDGLTFGTNANANANTSLYRFFTFKDGANFMTGNYAGNGTNNTDITAPGFEPDLVLTKRQTSSTGGVFKPSSLAGDSTQYFMNLANVSGRIKQFNSDGFRIGTDVEVNASGSNYFYVAWKIPVTILAVDIVDSGGTTVGSPSVGFSLVDSTIGCQVSTATLGVSGEKIRVYNTTGNPAWTLTIAAQGGITSVWDAGASTDYDFNDPTGTPAGCGDGGDADAFAGQLSFDFSGATITPEGGCSATGVTFGSNTAFNQGTTDSILVVQASGSADTGCYWDITGVDVTQRIPGQQTNGSYSLGMSLSVAAN